MGDYVYTTVTTTTTTITTVSSTVDLSIAEGVDMDDLTNCLLASCLSNILSCNEDSKCNDIGSGLVTETDLTVELMAAIVWDLGKEAETNEVVQELLTCSDDNCGTRAGPLTWHKYTTSS